MDVIVIIMEKESVAEKISMPRIGDLVPDFEAETTHERKKLSIDYNGKWVILFSHPADFHLFLLLNLSRFQKYTLNYRIETST
jgi:peroxiredoxin (alkyl hydroperoxide reductase subunit C)